MNIEDYIDKEYTYDDYVIKLIYDHPQYPEQIIAVKDDGDRRSFMGLLSDEGELLDKQGNRIGYFTEDEFVEDSDDSNDDANMFKHNIGTKFADDDNFTVTQDDIDNSPDEDPDTEDLLEEFLNGSLNNPEEDVDDYDDSNDDNIDFDFDLNVPVKKDDRTESREEDLVEDTSPKEDDTLFNIMSAIVNSSKYT